MDFDDFAEKKNVRLGESLPGRLNSFRSMKMGNPHLDQLYRMRNKIDEKQAFIEYLNKIPG